MAKYRITIDAFVDVNDTNTRNKIKDGIVALQSKLKRANAVETSRISVHKCYHDETPNKPCEPPIYEWEKA